MHHRPRLKPTTILPLPTCTQQQRQPKQTSKTSSHFPPTGRDLLHFEWHQLVPRCSTFLPETSTSLNREMVTTHAFCPQGQVRPFFVRRRRLIGRAVYVDRSTASRSEAMCVESQHWQNLDSLVMQSVYEALEDGQEDEAAEIKKSGVRCKSQDLVAER